MSTAAQPTYARLGLAIDHAEDLRSRQPNHPLLRFLSAEHSQELDLEFAVKFGNDPRTAWKEFTTALRDAAYVSAARICPEEEPS